MDVSNAKIQKRFDYQILFIYFSLKISQNKFKHFRNSRFGNSRFEFYCVLKEGYNPVIIVSHSLALPFWAKARLKSLSFSLVTPDGL